LPLPKDEFAEILVSRDQYAGRNPTLHQDDFIHDPRRHLGDVCNLMAIEAKAFDNLTVDAFIGEESHRGVVSRG
jgi:O-methyltransferase involved in polyketide biosynthesis